MPHPVLLTAALALALAAGTAQTQPALSAASVRASNAGPAYRAEGVVEAVRQTVVAAQVAGPITELLVKPGDSVRAGQVLARIDARAANQAVAASRAQVEAARATLAVAARDYARQQQLFQQKYISQSSLDQAEAQFKQSQANANALIAQADASHTQSSWYAVLAPYAGLVAEVPVSVGDMAMPGRALATVYDPTALRVLVTAPQQMTTRLASAQSIVIDIPGLPEGQRHPQVSRVTLLPLADAATHTVQLRLDLAGSAGATPGMFARALLPQDGAAGARLFVPAGAVFRRAELTAVYVLDAKGKPALRQVRAGPQDGAEREILSGVSAGEKVALDPIAAAAATR